MVIADQPPPHPEEVLYGRASHALITCESSATSAESNAGGDVMTAGSLIPLWRPANRCSWIGVRLRASFGA
jgi:hypothetical protein